MELILYSLRLVMSMIPPISLRKEVAMTIDSDKYMDLQEDSHGGHLNLHPRLHRAGLFITHPRMAMRRRAIREHTILNSPGVNMKT
jgi:hypothetical protein